MKPHHSRQTHLETSPVKHCDGFMRRAAGRSVPLFGKRSIGHVRRPFVARDQRFGHATVNLREAVLDYRKTYIARINHFT